MPGKVKVKIIAGRNLPVMDRSSDTTDAYVEIKLGNTTYKTDVCRKSLNPQWNSEWYRFEVDDSELQDEPLQIRLMDHDTYSANDAIGKVYLNLNPLLIPSTTIPGKYAWGGDSNSDQPSSSVLSGWIPVYDTMHGIRGEVNVTVKVELFSDFNKFRQSSCGVQFFRSPVIPHGFHAQVIHGFIEELIVNDDPEYQWIDKIRTPRASNEARQTILTKLNGVLQRKIGVKALDLGGNAIIGYSQCFDLEGESGIVGRGIGTVVTLVKHHEMQQQLDIGIAEEKALSYLKFLAFDNGLKLDNDNIFERFTLSSSIPNSSVSVSIPDYPKEPSQKKNLPMFLRQSSQPLIEYEPLPFSLKTSFSSRSLTDDIKKEIALKQLLRQEEIRGSSASLTNKIKYLKQNMKSALKNKLSDSSMQESLNLDTASISSRGESSAIRTSLIDLRELRKKKKQSSNKNYMAQLLVRSVMTAYTSLDCIVECHDSGPAHSSSVTALNEETEECNTHQNNETHTTNLEVKPPVLNKTISEPYLLLPDTAIVTPSSNASSDSELSSSDGSDSPSEIKDKLEFDTVSLIVKNVQNEQKAEQELEFSYFNDSNESDRRLSVTAPVLQINDDNLFLFPINVENKIVQVENNEDVSKIRPPLIRTISKSCTDITDNYEIENNFDNSVNIILPKDMEKRIANLRHSALFKSIVEKPKNPLTKILSISHEDVSVTNEFDNLVPDVIDPNRKRRKSISFTDLTEINELENKVNSNVNIVLPKDMEKRIANLRHSALFKSIVEKPKNPLTKVLSISHEDFTVTNEFDNSIPDVIDPNRKRRISIAFTDLTEINEIENNSNVDIVLPKDMEKRIANLKHSALFKSIVERPKSKLNKTFSISHEDVTNTMLENLENNVNSNVDIVLPKDMEKRIAYLRHSALFNSFVERPRSKLNKTFSISHEDVTNSNTIFENLIPDAEIDLRKRRLSISCTDISDINELEKLRDISMGKKPEVRQRGKLQRTFSISCEEMEQDINIEETKMKIPIDLEKKITKLIESPVFSDNKTLNKQLSQSCTDLPFEENKIPQNIEQKLDMFRNSPLFKFSFMTEPKNKLNKQLSKSHGDISSKEKENFESNSISQPDLSNFPLVKTAMHTILQEKINLLTSQQAPISPRASAELLSQSNPDLGDSSLIKTAMQTILMEKIDLMTAQNAPVSKRVKEEFQKSTSNSLSKSDPDIRQDFIKSTIHKIHIFPKKSPSFLRKHRCTTGSLQHTPGKSDFELKDHNSVKSLIMDKIQMITTKSPPHSPTQSEVSSDSLVKTAMQTILMERVNILTPPVSSSIENKFVFDERRPSKEKTPWKDEIKEDRMTKTAMQTMLLDKANIMSVGTPPISPIPEGEPSTPKSSKHPNLDKIKTTVHHVLDKVHILSPKHTEKSFFDSDSEPSLMKTAMETMLIDKVNIMASENISVTTSGDQLEEEKHHHHNHHHHHGTLDSVKSAVHSVIDKVSHISPTSPKHEKPFDFNKDHSEPSLMKTAMETMLIDKVNVMASENISVTTSGDQLEEEKHHHHHHGTLDSVKSAVHSVIDKVSHMSPTSPKHDKPFDFSKEEHSEPSLMKTAMETMLIDKVNIMASENISITTSGDQLEIEKHHHHNHHHHGTLDSVKSAVHSVIDKVSHMSPTSPKHDKKFHFSKEDHSEPSLTKTAMQTMLIDKVNILAPEVHPTAEEEIQEPPAAKHEHRNIDIVKSAVHTVLEKVHNLSSPVKEKKFEFDKNPPEDSLMQTAMQTMLIDKVNIIAPSGAPVSSTTSEDNCFEPIGQKPSSEPGPTEESVEEQSLMKTAMSTELMEKVNIVATTSVTTIPENTEEAASSVHSSKTKKHSFFSTIKKKCKSLKPKNPFSKFMRKTSHPKEEGLVESAMTTILMDRVNSIQGILKSNKNPPEKPSPNSVETPTPTKACSKEKLNEITTSPCIEEPNIAMRPDTGDSCNRGTAITADDANCNTNAEHAPCLYTSDRRIVESPVPSAEREREREKETVRERHGHQRTESTGGKMSQSPARLNAIPCIHRRSSDSDLSITPKGNSLTGSDRSGGTIPGYHHIRSTLLRPTVDNFDMMEYPFLTMSKYPPGFILHLGGAVSARSVKLLERITNIEEPETRDTWWSELRMEIRTHARALNCNAVLGYTESTSICDEVCVLSASGTAAVIALYSGEMSDGITGLPNLHKSHVPNKDLMTSSLDRTDFEREKNAKHSEPSNTNSKITQVTESPEHEATIEFSGANTPAPVSSCRICHIPYSESSMSFRVNMLYCSICKMAKVPDILLTTIEMPDGLPITGRGCFLQSYVCRPKRDLKGELNAKEISESLPFLEYELHRLLVNKMKVKAMNTIFGLKVRITIGERMLVGVATGTAVFLLPLPPPPLPKLIAGNATTEDKKLAEMQKLLVDTVKKNKEIYELRDTDIVQPIKLLSDNEESDDEKSNLDLGSGNKDSCVLEVDDSEDIEVINLLVEPRPPDGFHVVNTENVPGLEELEIVKNLQMFTQVWRSKIPLNQSASHFGKHFQKLLQSVYFKLRRMIPCALCDLQFRVDLPEPDEIQLTLLGMALGLGDPMRLNKFKRKCHLPSKELNKKSDDELIFSLEEDHIPENSIPVINQSSLLNPQMPKHRQKSPQRLRINPKQRHTPIKERHGVDITPLSYVPGGKIERYLGYLNFFFIRETTSIREGGGLSGFVHSFITEVLAIVRAHVTALGGNAMVSYFMTECVLYHNAHKNQGQCLINVGGDVVFVSYFPEDN